MGKNTFGLPGIRESFDLYSRKRPVQFQVIEVGIHSDEKESQLKDRRSIVFDAWGKIIDESEIDWYPEVYRTLIYFLSKPQDQFYPDSSRRVIHFSKINPSNTQSLTVQQLNSLAKYRDVMTKSEFKGVVSKPDAHCIEELIGNKTNSGRRNNLRGKVAEYIALNTMAEIIPSNEVLIRNGKLQKALGTHAETDGLHLFYRKSGYQKTIQALERRSNITIFEHLNQY